MQLNSKFATQNYQDMTKKNTSKYFEKFLLATKLFLGPRAKLEVNIHINNIQDQKVACQKQKKINILPAIFSRSIAENQNLCTNGITNFLGFLFPFRIRIPKKY